MISKGTFNNLNTQEFEADFAFSWLSKFAQAIIAILPGLVISIFVPFLTRSFFVFVFVSLFSIFLAWIINEVVAKKLSKEKESLLPRCLAYTTCFLAINILHQNGFDNLIANLTLTSIIVFQSVFISSFQLAILGLLLTYLTSLFYILPGPNVDADLQPITSVQLYFFISVFLGFGLAFYYLVRSIGVGIGKRLYNHIGNGLNSVLFIIFFGIFYAQEDVYRWGILMASFSLICLLFGFFYYKSFSSKKHSLIWFYLFAFFSSLGLAFIARDWKLALGWEIVALVMVLISHKPKVSEIGSLAIVINQLVFVYFLVSQPFAKFFDLEPTISFFPLLILCLLFYIVSSGLGKGKRYFKGNTPIVTTLQSVMAFIVAIPLFLTGTLLSVSWAVTAFVILSTGFLVSDYSLRASALIVLFVAVFKILIGDTPGLAASGVLLPLIIISPILIISSLIYQKMQGTEFRPNIRVEKTHSLAMGEARKRVSGLIEALEVRYANLFSGGKKSWDERGEKMDFSFDTFGMHIQGQVVLEESRLELGIQIPFIGMIFKEKILTAVESEIEELLKTA